ncbi:putative lea domain-containing protein [Phaeoacremonium minimum UCRPA7]|uniref:Putative lea domain-containing protein n=1 Tax=Phaeoacremonium minimum (strain UCR-PA7) TaxID=1286976 RepID=R8BV46_PHAM7|nr:putative lea domain-containing protein [Phaeoacremonium minimum UCRPA7]EOO03227.1 putative lea domain-containing protein [Phaeoacremonium minimum UCRPA7]
MSFLTEAAARRLASVPRAVATSGFTTTVPRASFTTSIQLQKTATETVKDSLKTVDRAVSDKLVDGINITTNAASKVKEAAGEASSGKVTGQAAELRGEASGKASELKGEAKGKAHEVAGKAKGAAEEAKQKI